MIYYYNMKYLMKMIKYSIQFMLTFCSMLLFIEAMNSDDELFAVNINGANTYSSSVASGSLSEYSVDDDFMHIQPTCFQTDSTQPDLDGYHWLMIDFGINLHHIKEIRLAPNPFHKNFATKLSDIDVFLIQNGESLETDEMLASLRQTNHNIPKRIRWDSKGIKFCQSTGNVTSGTRAATIECSKEINAKWLVLRRMGELDVCLVSVYVKNAFEECFMPYSTEKQQIWPSLSGQPFSFIRHLSKSACRAGCSTNKNCQAIRYKKIRRTGVCEQIRDVILSEDQISINTNETNHVSHDSLLQCESENCTITLNKCHLGRLQELHQVKNLQENDTGTSVSDVNTQNELQSENKFSLWEIRLNPDKTKIDATMKSKPELLFSIQMDGYLYCSKAVCDTLKIYAMDENNEAILCGEIDSRIVSHLNKYYLFCQNNYPVNTMKFIRLEWNNMGRENAGYLHVNITQMFVRITHNAKLFNMNSFQTTIPMTTYSTTTEKQFLPPIDENETVANEQYTIQQHMGKFEETNVRQKQVEHETQHSPQETELLQQYYQYGKEELGNKREGGKGDNRIEVFQHQDQYNSEDEQYNEVKKTDSFHNDLDESSRSTDWSDSNTNYRQNEEDEYDTSSLDLLDKTEEDDDEFTHQTENQSNKQITNFNKKQNQFSLTTTMTTTRTTTTATTELYEILDQTDNINHMVTDSWVVQSNLRRYSNENNYDNKNLLSIKLGVREVRRDNGHNTSQLTEPKQHQQQQQPRNLEKKSLQSNRIEKNTRNTCSMTHNFTFLLFSTIVLLTCQINWLI
ncbi:hypothetical protein EWB00_004853 [Schistosoma japonicum]|uniref:Uncharacterized protein n=1 Tax=Schistosoma japonicum TaxID=6182 RepID=A0A4Z2D3T3_SCHJA|nr:hypothetical protein EWB00_004853 [Schistosoma japonicum]